MRTLILFLLSYSLSCVEIRVYPVIGYRVIDGDTIEVQLDLGFDLVKKSAVRLAGINAPETRGIEREFGLKVKEYVIKYLEGKVITCQWLEDDKYGGRFVGKVFVDDVDLAVHLVELGYAKLYDGNGPKPTFE